MKEHRQFYVYILTNKTGTVLYTGVTNDLSRRVLQHKQRLAGSFTARYNVDRLVTMRLLRTSATLSSERRRSRAGHVPRRSSRSFDQSIRRGRS
jgi:putative endonuclease